MQPVTGFQVVSVHSIELAIVLHQLNYMFGNSIEASIASGDGPPQQNISLWRTALLEFLRLRDSSKSRSPILSQVPVRRSQYTLQFQDHVRKERDQNAPTVEKVRKGPSKIRRHKINSIDLQLLKHGIRLLSLPGSLWLFI